MKKLENLRQRIDRLDDQLLHVLKKRFQIVNQIGILKKELKLSAMQPQRWDKVIKARLKIAEQMKLRKSFILEVFNLIHQESLQQQNNLRNKCRDGET